MSIDNKIKEIINSLEATRDKTMECLYIHTHRTDISRYVLRTENGYASIDLAAVVPSIIGYVPAVMATRITGCKEAKKLAKGIPDSKLVHLCDALEEDIEQMDRHLKTLQHWLVSGAPHNWNRIVGQSIRAKFTVR